MSVRDQVERRRRRATEETFSVENMGPHPLFSTFEVASSSGKRYRVEIRSTEELLNSCSCQDYMTNTLGTCKHIEGVLLHLQKNLGARFHELAAEPVKVNEIFLQWAENPVVRLAPVRPVGGRRVQELLGRYFDPQGVLQGPPAVALAALLAEIERLPAGVWRRILVRDSVRGYLQQLEELESIEQQKRWFLAQVSRGNRSADPLSVPLYPFQREGMLHLAFGRRALLADDMGLGKTVQAIAAAVLLQQLRGIERVLVVCPASLKHQWAREIGRFTSHATTVIQGPRKLRRGMYRNPSFFNIVNYELIRYDLEELEARDFDLVILDEAQRIKNWRTKTADAVKRLRSRFAFVLTGTPLENRLDELYSIFQFIDPRILGPLWRFNQRYFVLRRRRSGTFKVLGYRNLDELRRRIAPYVVRRTRDDVMDDLPERTDNNFFVEMTAAQAQPYEEHRQTVARLAAAAERRPLTPKEQDILLQSLLKMRLICDALALEDDQIPPDQVEKTSPKLRELALILEDEVVAPRRKAILFSQWNRMLELVERILEQKGIGYVKLTGDVPTAHRGKLIERFFDDPGCLLFLSTDAGGVGLNLQAASLVINIELPWNPAVLEQRIARAHRHGQRHPVQVINLVTSGSIEERMLDTLAGKRSVFDGVFSGDKAPDEVLFADTGQGLLRRLGDVLGSSTRVQASSGTAGIAAEEEPRPAPSLAELGKQLAGRFPGRILLVAPAPQSDGQRRGRAVLVVVDRAPAEVRPHAEKLAAELLGEDGGPPELLLMEREGYRALTALTGGLPLAGMAPEEAFVAPSLAPSATAGETAPRRELVSARRGIAEASRKLELARVVLEAGFVEAVGEPLRAALGLGVTSLMALEGGPDPSSELPPARRIHQELVRKGILEASGLGGIATVRDLTEPAGDGAPPLPAETFRELLATVEDVLDLARQRITAAAL